MKVEKEAEINRLKSDLRIVRDNVLSALAILDQNSHYTADIESVETLICNARGFICDAIYDIGVIKD